MYSSLFVAAMAFTYFFGGALLGFYLQQRLPAHHLDKESRKTAELAAALISTMAALILGLMVASSKSSFDEVNAKISDAGAKAILLDRTLCYYGADAGQAREKLRDALTLILERTWPKSQSPVSITTESDVQKGKKLEDVGNLVRAFKTENEEQHELKSTALRLCEGLEQTRWEMIESKNPPLPVPILGITFFWLTALLTLFCLFAPRTPTMLMVIFICAISISGAIYLFLELGNPQNGLIRISPTPIEKTLREIGQ